MWCVNNVCPVGSIIHSTSYPTWHSTRRHGRRTRTVDIYKYIYQPHTHRTQVIIYNIPAFSLDHTSRQEVLLETDAGGLEGLGRPAARVALQRCVVRARHAHMLHVGVNPRLVG